MSRKAGINKQQEQFIQHLLAGMNDKQAAISAGYSAATAKQSANRLKKNPLVVKRLAELRENHGNSAGETQDSVSEFFNRTFADPKEFMEATMNCPLLGHGIRFEASKQLMPYYHGRVADTGKKQAKSDAAAKSAKTSKFKPKQPPKLSVVGN